MKKIIASAVGLMLAGGIAATTASAVENQFGGYWRSRFTYEDNMTGLDTASTFYVDQRTRLYYTAKFSDSFKFVNKFEFNSTWGDTTQKQTYTNGKVTAKSPNATYTPGVAETVTTPTSSTTTFYPYTASGDVSTSGATGAGGDVGADGKGNFRIKNSYVDFDMGSMFNAKVGIQGATVARGFLFDDDFSGAIVTGKFGNVTVPLVFIDAQEKDSNAYYWDMATSAAQDQRIYAALVSVKINDDAKVTPYFVFNTISDNGPENTENWYLGVDGDLKFGSVGVWGTAIYEGGSIAGVDNAAFLGAVGVDAGIAHGQFFYASGDDGSDPDENTAFVNPPGRSYYWAQIMGLGIFDNHVSAGAPGDGITNVMAGNGGVMFKPMDKLKLTGDVWYAALAEENKNGDTELGVEFDGVVSYNIYDNLTADVVLAYLLSGDATGDEDVIEGGVRLSLSF